MVSKRAISSVPGLFRLVSPAPARTLSPSRRNVSVAVFLPSITVRLAHSIPRPRNPSPFTQQQQQSTSTTTTTTTTTTSPPSSETSTSTQTSSIEPSQASQRTNNNNPRNIIQKPHYELTFTCRPCGTRSRHRVSKQGYHHGTVLIACPSCRSRHVIADHLRVFGDKAMTVEDLLRERGEQIKRGSLGVEGDVEFWEDGTTTVREPWVEKEKQAGESEAEEDLPPGATFKSVKRGSKKGEDA
ncbi:zf-DNL-domain-containing protein [Parathielavia appendiculata]|uniref:Zf-DNL-domain-containing protein n=1 Tax=Parathielavia appendiculata TaxID=2587402 RepID=A0AAN6U9T3_9PEZI|nr:zf-DNL-domain-containing protein [Parathielavia appendiculata]